MVVLRLWLLGCWRRPVSRILDATIVSVTDPYGPINIVFICLMTTQRPSARICHTITQLGPNWLPGVRMPVLQAHVTPPIGDQCAFFTRGRSTSLFVSRKLLVETVSSPDWFAPQTAFICSTCATITRRPSVLSESQGKPEWFI
jgi:hypothetical protein